MQQAVSRVAQRAVHGQCDVLGLSHVQGDTAGVQTGGAGEARVKSPASSTSSSSTHPWTDDSGATSP